MSVVWRRLTKGEKFMGALVITETWFAVECRSRVVVGALARSDDDRWLLGMLMPNGQKIMLFKPAALTVVEVKQMWEAEYAHSRNG